MARLPSDGAQERGRGEASTAAVVKTMQEADALRTHADSEVDVSPAPRRRARTAGAEHEPSVADLVWVLIERRWSVAIVACAVIACAVAYLLVVPPVYKSSVLIQVEGRSRPVIAFEDLAPLFQEQTPTEGEMRIMKSRTLLNDVVDQLGLDVDARPRTLPVVGAALARRHRGPDLAPAPFGLSRFAWGGERIRLEQLTVSDTLLSLPLVITALEGGRYRLAASDGAVLVAEGQVGKTVKGTDGTRSVELRVSELTARPQTEFTAVKLRRLDVIEGLQHALRISEQGRLTGLVEVGLSGHDPEQLAAILDAVAANYRRQSVERTSVEAAKTLAVLEAQLPVLRSNLERAERSLNAFHRKHGTATLSLGGEALLERLRDVDRAIAENEVRAAELTRFTDKHPDLQVLAQRTQRLHAQRAVLEARMQELPQLELDSTRLSRQLRVATELYMLVHNRAEELRIVKSGWIGNVRVLEKAVQPFRPASPNWTIVLSLATLVGLGAGIAVASARNAFDDAVRDPDELEAGIGVPVMATIPRSAAQRKLARRGRHGRLSTLSIVDPGDAAVEELRGLRTSVQFALLRARNNVIVIGGLAPKAGKSLVSVNLAHLLAAAGGRVLLVDADLRRGILHRYFGMQAHPGLADVVSGASKLEDALQVTDVPNLDLLPAGRLPRNPSELLAGAPFQHVLDELGRRYKAVVVDTPPILAVTDSALVGRLAGVNLIVLRAGEHAIGEISSTLRRLVQNGVTIRGVILNEVRPAWGRYGRAGRYRRYDLVRDRDLH